MDSLRFPTFPRPTGPTEAGDASGLAGVVQLAPATETVRDRWAIARAVAVTVGSMVLFGWVLARGVGVEVACGLVGVLFVHEMGHYLVIRIQGLRASVPVFIPFVGAVIHLKDPPRGAMEESLIGYGGPLAGGIASALCGALYLAGFGTEWGVIAFAGGMLNLVNMVPLRPLDGGRILAAVSRHSWWLGLPIVLFFLAMAVRNGAFMPAALLTLVLLAFRRHMATEAHIDPRRLGAFYRVSAATRWGVLAMYVGLAVGLSGLLVATAPALDEWMERRAPAPLEELPPDPGWGALPPPVNGWAWA